MIKVIVIEDNEEFTNTMKDFIFRYSSAHGEKIEVEYYRDGMDFIDGYKSDADAIFMDIEMPHMDGLEAARRLRKKDKDVPLVFVTVMAQYAIKGYEVDAMDFIVKPMTYLNFSYKLDKALSLSRRHKESVILLNSEDGVARVNIPDIRYAESLGHYCIFHTVQGGTYKKYMTMKELDCQLKQEGFLRCNNSFIVNPNYVVKLKRESVIVGEDEVPVSRQRRKEFVDALTDFFGGKA